MWMKEKEKEEGNEEGERERILQGERDDSDAYVY